MTKNVGIKAFELIFENMSSASSINEIVYENGKAVDYIILEANRALEKLLDLPREKIVGRLASEVYGMTPPIYLEKYVQVAEAGVPEDFVVYFPPADKYLEIRTSCPAKGMFSNVVTDVTEDLKEKESVRLSEKRLRCIVDIFQRKFDMPNEILDYALDGALSLTESKIGYIFHYSEEHREFRLHAWSKEVMPECSVMNPQTCYELSKTGLWGEAVRQRKAIVVNEFSAENPLIKGTPEGHVELNRLLTIPIIMDEKIVGVIGVANKESDYNDLDTLQLQVLMDAVWKIAEQRRTEKELHRIEWMLSNSPEDIAYRKEQQSYGDLTSLNQNGLILNSLGSIFLEGMVVDYLDLLNSSSAVCEVNGDYAMRLLASGWCRLLDESSRSLCNSNADALKSGKWLCHESCWTNCCKKAIETEETVDIECNGGIRIYAVPIKAKNKVVGAISFAYGDPPRDMGTLGKLAELYQVDIALLEKASSEYHSRPAYIIEMAKKRLQSTALLIGSIVETKYTESQLRQAMKMDAVGRLAGGVAHDFNNMLGVILGHAEMALLATEPSDIIRADIENIISAGNRSAKLTQQLLAFARKQTIDPIVLDLNETVSSMRGMLRRLIGENIQLIFKGSKGTKLVKMDPTQIDQILVNLILNSSQAISGSGKITVETESVKISEEQIPSTTDIVPGNYAVLSIRDDGCGMSKKLQEQIFEPFFTTRTGGRGTGLGLATVYGIVRQNNGIIKVDSEVGVGSTFKVCLPLVENCSLVKLRALKEDELLRGSETILLVEDEKPLLALAQKMLEKLGYKVLPANCPLEALKLVEESRETIDMVLTDVVMPHMNGSEMFNKLCEKIPDLKCLFMSGYTADIIANHGALKEGCNFIEKPFNLMTMSRKLREALEKTDSAH